MPMLRLQFTTKTTYTLVPKNTPSTPSLPDKLTCPWNDDDKAATSGQLADEREVVAEGLGVRDEVGRHG